MKFLIDWARKKNAEVSLIKIYYAVKAPNEAINFGIDSIYQ